MKKPPVKNEESPFQFSEIFFSRTDKRGIIQACNRVFTRVSGYQEAQMLGQPHNLVRHPDMPKAVFRLFWDTLKANQPIVAYVKNLSSDGKYYWVLAAAFPVEEGYVSIRIKPGAPLFQQIKEIYEKIRKEELTTEKSPHPLDLIELLKELGFSSYQAMSTQALMDEFEYREKQIQAEKLRQFQTTPTHSSLRKSDTLESVLSLAQQVCAKASESYSSIFKLLTISTDLNQSLIQESQTIKQAYHGVKFLAVNMSISSEKIGNQGQSLSTISATFDNWGNEAKKALEEFIEALTQAASRLDIASFYTAASRLQVTMIHAYSDEIRSNQANTDFLKRAHSDLITFVKMAIAVFKSAQQSVSEFLASIRSLKSNLNTLHETINALYIVRQSGKIEVSQLGLIGEKFIQHLEELGNFTQAAAQSLEKISSASFSVDHSMDQVKHQLNQITAEFQTLTQLQSQTSST